jgi:hypothetical protein
MDENKKLNFLKYAASFLDRRTIQTIMAIPYLNQSITQPIVELTLVDPHTSIIININPDILANVSDYFKKLFESRLPNITIKVSHATISYHIIMTFCGELFDSKDFSCRFILETIKCKNYFCLDCNISILYNLFDSQHQCMCMFMFMRKLKLSGAKIL